MSASLVLHMRDFNECMHRLHRLIILETRMSQWNLYKLCALTSALCTFQIITLLLYSSLYCIRTLYLKSQHSLISCVLQIGLISLEIVLWVFEDTWFDLHLAAVYPLYLDKITLETHISGSCVYFSVFTSWEVFSNFSNLVKISCATVVFSGDCY